MFGNDENLVNRRKQSKNDDNHRVSKDDIILTEKVYILALRGGRTSFWNDHLSLSLRAGILIDLAMRKRIELEPASAKRKTLSLRRVLLKCDLPTGERLLDATLKLIKNCPEPAPVSLWLEYLSGENWNPWTWKLQLKNVKERVAKDLVEKGVLTISKTSYFFFESITYPLLKDNLKCEFITTLKRCLLDKWNGDLARMDLGTLALMLLVYCADLQEDVFNEMSVSDYSLGKRRLQAILDCDYDKEAEKVPESGVMWAVLASIVN